MSGNIHSAAAIAARIKLGVSTVEETIRQSLDAAEEVSELNIFTQILADDAMAQAKRIDADRIAGKALPPLAGVPFVIKDLLDLQGYTTVAGARMRLQDPPAKQTATVVAALMRAGAIPIGLTRMDEYACGATGENVIGGPVHNPLDPERITGGSSAGTAAAIAAGIVPFGIGSDTNGSIRAPASFCGIWGLRPTHGRLSVEGAYPYAESLDVIGPLAADAESLALSYYAMLPENSGGQAVSKPGSAATLRVGILRAGFSDFADAKANEAVWKVASAFASAEIIDWPQADSARDAASIISAFEVSRNHMQRDLSARHQEYSAFVRQRMLLGQVMPQEWYERAKHYQVLYKGELARLFERVDLLLAPSAPYAATPLGAECVPASQRDYVPRADAGHLTRPIALAGVPVISAPCSAEPLPFGVQLITPYGEDALCLEAALYLENEQICRRQPPRKQ